MSPYRRVAVSDWQLRGRILGTIAAMIVVNVAFVAAMVWLVTVLLPALLVTVDGQGTPEPLVRLPVNWGWLLAGGLVFLSGQLIYGYLRALSGPSVRTTTPAEAPTVHALVSRLAKSVDVSKPTVAVIDAKVPNCYTVGHARSATIVVTEPLLETIDEEQLEAVLAHEIAHIKNRDVAIMTVASLLSTVTQLLVAVAVSLRVYVFVAMDGVASGRSSSNDDGRAKLLLVLLAAAVFLTVVVVVNRLFRIGNRMLNRVLSRYREYAADREAAEILGDPRPLANALAELDDAASNLPQSDLRTEDSGVQALCILPHGAPMYALDRDPVDDSDDRFSARFWSSVSDALLPCSHPDTERRIEALTEIDTDPS